MQLHKLITQQSRSWYVWGIFVILVITVITRIYNLGTVPRSLSLDEVAIGYNGFAVAHTGRDEWLKIFPISFKSFSDYKAPLAIYLNGLFTLLFGLEAWVVRLPAALAGIIGVAMMILVTRELARAFHLDEAHPQLPKWLALGSGALLSTSPWFVHFNRIAFESGIALTILLTALYLFLKYLSSSHLKWLLGSAGFFAATLYTYHSPKVVVPLLLILLIALWGKVLWRTKQSVIVAAVLGTVLLLPMVFDTLYGSGAERLTQVTVQGNSGLEVAQSITSNYLDHLGLDFLVKGETTSYRHGDGVWGVLLWPTLAASLVGLVTLVLTRNKPDRQFLFFSLIWVVVGLLPAALGNDTPHSNRSLLALPGFIWLAVLGVHNLAQVLEKTRWASMIKGSHDESYILAKAVIGLLLLIQSLLFIAYQRDYYQVYAKQIDEDFQAGYLELFETLQKYEDDPLVRQIKVSNRFGSSYIYAIFSKKMNPFIYNYGGLSRYLLVDKVEQNTLLEPNMVIVATKLDDMPFEQAVEVINDQHGNIRFAIFVTKGE